MALHQLLKTIFLIPPFLVLAFVAHAIRVGRVRTRSLTYERARNPAMFWLGISIWLLLALALAGLQAWLTT